MPGNPRPLQCSDTVTIHTDGACETNPGRGGWAAILRWRGHERRISGGCRHTTNNRMELRAVIEALRALNRPGLRVHLVSDSQYVIRALERRWLWRWMHEGFRKQEGMRENADLWRQLAALVGRHHLSTEWVRGHHQNVLNAACDRMAVRARMGGELEEDRSYISRDDLTNA